MSNLKTVPAQKNPVLDPQILNRRMRKYAARLANCIAGEKVGFDVELRQCSDFVEVSWARSNKNGVVYITLKKHHCYDNIIAFSIVRPTGPYVNEEGWKRSEEHAEFNEEDDSFDFYWVKKKIIEYIRYIINETPDNTKTLKQLKEIR